MNEMNVRDHIVGDFMTWWHSPKKSRKHTDFHFKVLFHFKPTA